MPGSNYLSLNVECFDEKRDALTFTGDNPVICHPPCRLFGRLYKSSTAPGCERLLGIFSVLMVQKNGGIVEQPAGSKLWALTNISRSTTPDKFNGYIISINQFWFGYPCIKKTDLYVCGCPLNSLPALPLRFDAVQRTIDTSRSNKKIVTKQQRSETTTQLAEWLISIARLCSKKIQQPAPPVPALDLCRSCKNPIDNFDIIRNRCSICGCEIQTWPPPDCV